MRSRFHDVITEWAFLGGRSLSRFYSLWSAYCSLVRCMPSLDSRSSCSPLSRCVVILTMRCTLIEIYPDDWRVHLPQKANGKHVFRALQLQYVAVSSSEWRLLDIWDRADTSDLDPLPARHHRVLNIEFLMVTDLCFADSVNQANLLLRNLKIAQCESQSHSYVDTSIDAGTAYCLRMQARSARVLKCGPS